MVKEYRSKIVNEFMYGSVESKVEEKARWEAIGNGTELECGCSFCYCPNMVRGADICPECIEKEHPRQFAEYMKSVWGRVKGFLQEEY